MVSLPWLTWERLIYWFALGIVIYFGYSVYNSKLGPRRIAGETAWSRALKIAGVIWIVFGSLGSFLSSSKATMTSRAIADVSVDWQVEARQGADPASFLADVAAHPGVPVALPVGFSKHVAPSARDAAIAVL